ncbi:hypothetical protein [Candidatus Nitrosocosmicus franklandus]|nr:hypothetical protein [Candidatus Nitrosocosmicus franklandus]
MSKTKNLLNQELDDQIQTTKNTSILELEVMNGEQNTKFKINKENWKINNFVVCNRCFSFNPYENFNFSSPYASKICSECGNNRVRYVSTASSKLFDYVCRNIY